MHYLKCNRILIFICNSSLLIIIFLSIVFYPFVLLCAKGINSSFNTFKYLYHKNIITDNFLFYIKHVAMIWSIILLIYIWSFFVLLNNKNFWFYSLFSIFFVKKIKVNKNYLLRKKLFLFFSLPILIMVVLTWIAETIFNVFIIKNILELAISLPLTIFVTVIFILCCVFIYNDNKITIKNI
ncbi:Uncharacterised protein [Mycoplasmopsis columbina]|nr:Uncharacterised protein [Mycoplasmopsis columbina]